MMKTVTPTASFTGYVNGVRTEFTSGVSASVPADYAAILSAKGLIEKAKAKTPAPDADK